MDFDSTQFDPSADEYQKMQDSADYLAMIEAKTEQEGREWPKMIMSAVEEGERNIRRTADVFKDYLGPDYSEYLSAKLKYYKAEVDRIADMILGTTVWYKEDMVWDEEVDTAEGRVEITELNGVEIVEAVINDILDETLSPHPDVDAFEDEFAEAAETEPEMVLQNISEYAKQPFAKDLILKIAKEYPLLSAEYVSDIPDKEWRDLFVSEILYQVFNLNNNGYSPEERRHVVETINQSDPDIIFENAYLFYDEPWFDEFTLNALPLMEDPWFFVVMNLTYMAKVEGIEPALDDLSRQSKRSYLHLYYPQLVKYFPKYKVCSWISNAIIFDIESGQPFIFPSLKNTIDDVQTREWIYEPIAELNGEAMIRHARIWIDEPFAGRIAERLSPNALIENSYYAKIYPQLQMPLREAYLTVATRDPRFIFKRMGGIEDLGRANEVFGAITGVSFGEVALYFYAWYTRHTEKYSEEILKPEETLKDFDKIQADWFPRDLKFSDKVIFAILVCRNINSQGSGNITEENVKAEYGKIIRRREELGDLPIFEGRNVILASHLEKKDGKDRFGLKTLQDRIRVLQGDDTRRFSHFEASDNTITKLQKAKEDTLEAIRTTPSPLTFLFDGHGSQDGIYYSDGQIIEDRYRENSEGDERQEREYDVVKTETTRYIDTDEFAEALGERYAHVGESIKSDIFILATCYSYDFAYSVREKLIKKGVSVPIFISASERHQTASSVLENKYGDDLYDRVLRIEDERPTLRNTWENEHLSGDRGSTTTFTGGEDLADLQQIGDNRDTGDKLLDSMKA